MKKNSTKDTKSIFFHHIKHCKYGKWNKIDTCSFLTLKSCWILSARSLFNKSICLCKASFSSDSLFCVNFNQSCIKHYNLHHSNTINLSALILCDTVYVLTCDVPIWLWNSVTWAWASHFSRLAWANLSERSLHSSDNYKKLNIRI